MDEEAFLGALRAAPDDDVTRLVYADWLDERGDERAAFIRLEREYVALPEDDERRTGMGERLRRLAASLDPAWLCVVSRPAIELCELSFAFECPKQWDKLQPTEEEAVRFCEECRKNVYYCTSIREARDHARRDHCVAVDLRLRRSPGDLETPMVTMGIVIDPNWRDGPERVEEEVRRRLLENRPHDESGATRRRRRRKRR